MERNTYPLLAPATTVNLNKMGGEQIDNTMPLKSDIINSLTDSV